MLDDPNLVRWWAVAATMAYACLGAWIYGRHLSAGPPLLRWFALIVGAHVTLVSLAIVVNAASPFPPTPGVKVYAVVVTALTAATTVLVWRHRAD